MMAEVKWKDTNNIFIKGKRERRLTHKSASVRSGEKTVGFETTRRTAVRHFVNGQNPLLSHTIAIAFSLLLVLIVVSVLTTLRDDYSKFIGRNEISQVCLLLKGDIEKIVSDDRYISPTNTTKGKIFVRLPDRIADQAYRIRFVNSSLAIETLSQPRINDTCKPGFNLSYVVSASGGRTEVNYTLLDNGTKVIGIKKV